MLPRTLTPSPLQLWLALVSLVNCTSLADNRANAQTVLARCRGVITARNDPVALAEASAASAASALCTRRWSERIRSLNTALPSSAWPSRLFARRCSAVTKCASSNSERRDSTKPRMAAPLSKATIFRLSLTSKAGAACSARSARSGYRRGLLTSCPPE